MSQSEPLFEINPIGGRLGAEIRGCAFPAICLKR